MNDYQNNYLGEAVRQKIKLFTKKSFFKSFAYILTEKSKNLPAFRKTSVISFSDEILLKEKQKIANKLKLIKLEKEKSTGSICYKIMLLLANIPDKQKLEIKKNELNLNPICYSYITYLCSKKLKLLSSFSYTHKIPLDILVKFYLDLCVNQINQKEKEIDNTIENNQLMKSSTRLIDYKKLLQKKSSPQILLKKQNNQKNIGNNIFEKKKPILGPPPIEYSNSFARLFIGEIDPSSVRERYLSNIVVKKLKQLHLYSSYQDLSNMYLKRLYKKLFKKENKGIIDRDMADILNKFKSDTKKVENFQRNALSFDRKNIKDDYIDEEKQNLEIQLQMQKNVYMEQKKEKSKKRKSNKIISLSPLIIRNDNRINFRNIKNKSNNHSIIYNSNSNNSQYLSANLSSNMNRRLSEKNKRNTFKKKLDNINGRLSHSTIDIKYNNSGSPFKNYDTLLSKELQLKKGIIKRRNSIFKKIKKGIDEKKNIFNKKRRVNLKNYLKNEDFFFSKMN